MKACKRNEEANLAGPAAAAEEWGREWERAIEVVNDGNSGRERQECVRGRDWVKSNTGLVTT